MPRKPKSHDMHVAYTIDDDGIWLRCDDCRAEANLGYHPSVGQVAAAERAHKAEKGVRAVQEEGSRDAVAFLEQQRLDDPAARRYGIIAP